jgi:hypothetical protein
MSGREDPVTEGRLDALEQRLRQVAVDRDPVPPSVLDHAMHALELRDLDTELAALVADSLDADERLALVRGPQGTRLLTFEAPGVVVELQVTSTGDRRQLEGHVAGAGGCELSLEHPEGTVVISPDEHGRFQVDVVPAGRLRLHVRAEDRSVTTTWVDV